MSTIFDAQRYLFMLTKPMAIAMGSTSQFRLMGTAIGLAISSSVFNDLIRSHLTGLVSLQDISGLLQTSETFNGLDPLFQDQIRHVFVGVYNVLIGLFRSRSTFEWIYVAKENIIV